MPTEKHLFEVLVRVPKEHRNVLVLEVWVLQFRWGVTQEPLQRQLIANHFVEVIADMAQDVLDVILDHVPLHLNLLHVQPFRHRVPQNLATFTRNHYISPYPPYWARSVDCRSASLKT